MPLTLTAEIHASVLESIQTGLYLVDKERRIVLWNAGAERITGYFRHEVIGRICGQGLLCHSDENNVELCGPRCVLARTLQDGTPTSADANLRHKNGYLVPVRIHAVPVRDSDGHIVGAAESFEERQTDLSASRLLEGVADNGPMQEFAQQPDAGLVLAALQDHLDDLQQNGLPFGLLCIHSHGRDGRDDNRGVQASEKMLWVVAQTLARALRATDFLGRSATARLVVILAHCPSASITSIAQRLAALVDGSSIQWWGENVPIRVSIGAAAAHSDDTPQSILDRAEAALKAGLSVGGQRVVVF